MKQTETELCEQMVHRLAILQKISMNTKNQIKFIHQRKFKGLLRLLRERAQALQELAVLDQEINFTENSARIKETANEEIKKLDLLMKDKQQEILTDNNKALAAARTERSSIIADLCRVRSQKQMRNSYYTRWMSFTGKQLNQRG